MNKKVWGGSEIRLSRKYLSFLKLKYCLEDLKKVRGRILDVGCGAGGFAKAIKFYRNDLEVYGIDISKKAILKAQKNPEGVIFKEGSIYKLPFKDGFFDAVSIEDVLEHLEDPEKGIIEIARVLKKGGVFQFFSPLEGELFSLYSLLYKFGWRKKEKFVGHIQRFKRSNLEELLQERFIINAKRYSNHLFGQVIDVLFCQFIAEKIDTGFEEQIKGNLLVDNFKNLAAVLSNIESEILSIFPGGGVHIKARKK